MPKLSEEDRQEILLRYDLGLSIEKLAADFGVNYRTVAGLIPERRPQGPRVGPSVRRSDVRDDEVVRLRDVDGLSWARLAESIGMTVSGARNRYRRAKRRTELHVGDSVR